MLMLNRKDLIRQKLAMVVRESGRDKLYIKNWIKRHPDILMR